MSEKKSIKSIESLYTCKLYPREEREFDISEWKDFNPLLLQKGTLPGYTHHNYNIDEIVVVTLNDGDRILKCRYKPILREGKFYPCMFTIDYNYLLPTLLKYFGHQWWSPLSHQDLYYFKTTPENIREIEWKAWFCNKQINYDDFVSPCQQLVITTLLCNQDFDKQLPFRMIVNILTFLSQELFRGGNVMNCYPVEEDVEEDFEEDV